MLILFESSMHWAQLKLPKSTSTIHLANMISLNTLFMPRITY